MMSPDFRGRVWVTVILLLAGAAGGLHAAEVLPPVPKEMQDAVMSLASKDETVRQAAYAAMAKDGDARLIPILIAYHDGKLFNQNGRIILYGERKEIPGKGSLIPVIDAFTNQPVLNDKGEPQFATSVPSPTASNGVIRPPPGKLAEKAGITDLVSSLQLLDPNPEVRKRSIEGASEGASPALPNIEEEARFKTKLRSCAAALGVRLAQSPPESEIPLLKDALAWVAAGAAEKPASLIAPSPSAAGTDKAVAALKKLRAALPATDATAPLQKSIDETLVEAGNYQDDIIHQDKAIKDVNKTDGLLKAQLAKDPNGRFAPTLKSSLAAIDSVIGDRATQMSAMTTLGHIGTSQFASLLDKLVECAKRGDDTEVTAVAENASRAAEHYQTVVHIAQNTFAGVSQASILILLALGLSITFGLMGVINMAHGEFMMVGAFATFVVAEYFKHHFPNAFDWYPLVAIPAAFLAAGVVGLFCEVLVVRHLYGRPLETLLATWGVSLILIQVARDGFGDTLSVTPPSWMSGSWEAAPDLFFALNRVYIIIYCAICVVGVWFVINKSKVGLILRATTQNRAMASALGVPTRTVDAMTFAFGTGLAGLAGCAVPMFDKINPGMGQGYIVDSFLVVVVGGVGKLAGAIWAGLGLGFIGKYLEAGLGYIHSLASSSSVLGKVLVLALIVVFLQWKPSGLFPPKGRMADA